MARSLLVGSLNLESADAVFEAVGATLGDEVRRVPDGETGDRLGLDLLARPRIAATETLARTEPAGASTSTTIFPQYGPREGVAPEDVVFADLGYADDALASYERFDDVGRSVRMLPQDVRFQVALPTAYMALMSYIDLEHRDALAPRLRARARPRDRTHARRSSRRTAWRSSGTRRARSRSPKACRRRSPGASTTWPPSSGAWRRSSPTASSWASTTATATRRTPRPATASTGWSRGTPARWCA